MKNINIVFYLYKIYDSKHYIRKVLRNQRLGYRVNTRDVNIFINY